jgi:hypothetical protein
VPGLLAVRALRRSGPSKTKGVSSQT